MLCHKVLDPTLQGWDSFAEYDGLADLYRSMS